MRNIASRLEAMTVSATLVGGNSSSSGAPVGGLSETFSITTGSVNAPGAVCCEESWVDILLSTVEGISATKAASKLVMSLQLEVCTLMRNEDCGYVQIGWLPEK
jgi:hypothetical protein